MQYYELDELAAAPRGGGADPSPDLETLLVGGVPLPAPARGQEGSSYSHLLKFKLESPPVARLHGGNCECPESAHGAADLLKLTVHIARKQIKIMEAGRDDQHMLQTVLKFEFDAAGSNLFLDGFNCGGSHENAMLFRRAWGVSVAPVPAASQQGVFLEAMAPLAADVKEYRITKGFSAEGTASASPEVKLGGHKAWELTEKDIALVATASPLKHVASWEYSLRLCGSNVTKTTDVCKPFLGRLFATELASPYVRSAVPLPERVTITLRQPADSTDGAEVHVTITNIFCNVYKKPSLLHISFVGTRGGLESKHTFAIVVPFDRRQVKAMAGDGVENVATLVEPSAAAPAAARAGGGTAGP